MILDRMLTALDLVVPTVRNVDIGDSPYLTLGVVGWQYLGLQKPSPLLSDQIILRPDIDNPVDAGAVLVIEGETAVGYVRRQDLAPVHRLLENHFAHLCDQRGFHIEEMKGPVVINAISKQDDGRDWGSLLVLGLSGAPFRLSGDHNVERFREWSATGTRDGAPVKRSIKYGWPVSKAMVSSYLKRSGITPTAIVPA